jgi:predicted transcriptional regulator
MDKKESLCELETFKSRLYPELNEKPKEIPLLENDQYIILRLISDNPGKTINDLKDMVCWSFFRVTNALNRLKCRYLVDNENKINGKKGYKKIYFINDVGKRAIELYEKRTI